MVINFSKQSNPTFSGAGGRYILRCQKRSPNLTQCNLISQRSLGIPSEYLVVTCQHSYEVFHKDRYI